MLYIIPEPFKEIDAYQFIMSTFLISLEMNVLEFTVPHSNYLYLLNSLLKRMLKINNLKLKLKL